MSKYNKKLYFDIKHHELCCAPGRAVTRRGGRCGSPTEATGSSARSRASPTWSGCLCGDPPPTPHPHEEEEEEERRRRDEDPSGIRAAWEPSGAESMLGTLPSLNTSIPSDPAFQKCSPIHLLSLWAWPRPLQKAPTLFQSQVTR